MKLSALLENIEDDHSEVYTRYEHLKQAGKLTPAQIQHFEKLNRGFQQAYEDEDPHGNNERDYLYDMIELLDSVA